MADYTLSDSELFIMKVIWDSNKPLSMQEALSEVNLKYKKKWKAQTVSVFLGRIVKKKMLEVERKGRVFYYTPAMSKDEYCKKEVNKWVNALTEGKVDMFLKYLMDSRELTKEEKTNIKILIDEKDS